MKIERIELYHVAMPLIYPWRTAYGEDAAIHSLLCRMSSGSYEGWGESTPLAAPSYSPECAASALVVARDWLAPALIGKTITSGQQLQDALGVFKGNPFAKACFDNAWWAMEVQRTNTPLHQLLGHGQKQVRDAVPVGADFGVMDSVDELLESIGQAVERRFPRIKLKFRPGWDGPMVRAVRDAFPDQGFHIDCNSGYRIEDTRLFQELDDVGLLMIEQPLGHDDLYDHAQLQRAIRTPVCLDESITSPDQTRRAIAMKSCRYVNVKPGRVGGLTRAVQIHDLCQAANIPCWVGGMLESAVGAVHCTALAMLPNFTYPADIFPSSRFYHEDLADPPLELCQHEGQPAVQAPRELAQPVADRLEQRTLQRVVQTTKVTG